MTATRLPRLLFALLGVAALASTGRTQPSFAPVDETDGNSLVHLSVVAEHEALSPGQSTEIAVTFAVREGWHVYWRNPGDTGSQVRVNYEGPDWASIGELRWPVPERYISPGDLLDYVLEGEVTLLASLRVDEASWIEAGRPETLDFTLECEWFVCKEICLLGEGTDKLSIPVRSSGDVPLAKRHAKRFQVARSKLPTARQDVKAGTYSASFEAGVLTLAVPEASRLTFFPAPSEVLALPVDALGEAQKQGNRLVIRYRDAASSVDHLDGVLVIEKGQKDQPGYTRRAVEIRVPVTVNSSAE
ncbi:MAG: protein-disulfide reductase DsbD domain-containing protein [Phycisphaerales bacterium JB050]